MNTTRNSKTGDSLMNRELAELDLQMNAKESFAKRIGLLPFAAGAAAAAVVLAVMQFITHI